MRLPPCTSGVGFLKSNALKNYPDVTFGGRETTVKPLEKERAFYGNPSLDTLLDEALDSFEECVPALKGPKQGSPKLFSQIATMRTLAALNPEEVDPAVEPPQERIEKNRPRKLAVARQLSEWMSDTLFRMGANFAVVARQGGLAHKEYDRTGMLHTGIARFHPKEKQWKIYNLIDQVKTIGPFGLMSAGKPKCQIQWTEPTDFFYQQGGYQKNALLLIPDKATQANMEQAFSSGLYKKLALTSDYNMVSLPDTHTSLNCNKWCLLNILAARKEEYNPWALLADIRDNYRAGGLNVGFWQRLFAGWDPRVRGEEVPWRGPIYTVTVESLHDSGLFEQKIFCTVQPEETSAKPD